MAWDVYGIQIATSQEKIFFPVGAYWGTVLIHASIQQDEGAPVLHIATDLLQ